MIRRRPIELFSLSFMDCICCGFGAIILLFVLTMGSQTEAMRDVRERLQKMLRQQLTTLAQFKSKRDELQERQARVTLIEQEQKKQDTLQALLAELEQQIQYQQAGRNQMLVEIDELKRDIAARQKKAEIVLKAVPPTPVGLPADSTHVCFIIDTSGSMRDPTTERLWGIVLRKFDEVLDAYPNLKGLQFLDADGRFIFGGRTNEHWLDDTVEVRAAVKAALDRYDIFSNSNPVPGIMRAFRTLNDPNDPNMKMAIFVLGDEFTGTAEAVLRRLDELNPKDEKGRRRVVINAIGFPTAVKMGFSMGNTGVKLANLMREVTFQHGGAFIALQDIDTK